MRADGFVAFRSAQKRNLMHCRIKNLTNTDLINWQRFLFGSSEDYTGWPDENSQLEFLTLSSVVLINFRRYHNSLSQMSL